MKNLLIILFILCTVRIHGQTPADPSAPLAKAPPPETVFVLGEIRSPQVLLYAPGLTLTAAIGNAGGFADFGNMPICIIRDGVFFLKTTARQVFRNNPPVDPDLKPRDVVYLGRIN